MTPALRYWAQRARAGVAARVQRRRTTEPARAGPVVPGGPGPWSAILRLARDGPAPLVARRRSAEDAPLHVAVVIPPFRRGSGGHGTLMHLVAGLERRGHRVTLWLHDPEGRQRHEPEAVAARKLREFFVPVAAPLHAGFARWQGADVTMATGWQTVHQVLLLPGSAARAYLVQDFEPDFHAASAERLWAEATYRLGLHALCAGAWLERRVAGFGATTSRFDLAVDHTTYHAADGTRDPDRVLFYGRAVTGRRAVPLGLLALQELAAQRPSTRVAVFGETAVAELPFEHEHVGMLEAAALAGEYRRATAGLCLSLTNHSLVPLEMLACGLPCVDVAGRSWEAAQGAEGPVALAPPDPVALAATLAALLDDRTAWLARSRAGVAAMAERTWERAAGQVEAGLRAALAQDHR